MPDQKSDNVALIAGPTAGGKSALAITLAHEFHGEIVNADALQVYADLRILSARPGDAEEAAVRHHLFGVLDGDETCSAGRWAMMAEAVIGDITSRGKLAIIVGGTGLYFRALVEGLSPIPQTPDAVRAEARAHFDAIGSAAFHKEVLKADPAMARLAPGDTQRLLRAWEIFRVTGKPLSHFQAAPRQPIIAPPKTRLVLAPDRDVLYRRCEDRFEKMVVCGGLEEARRLAKRALNPGLPVMKALGAAELIAHLRGEISLDEAIALAMRNTRRFAKRQLTWFRNQMPGWAEADDSDQALSLLQSALAGRGDSR